MFGNGSEAKNSLFRPAFLDAGFGSVVGRVVSDPTSKHHWVNVHFSSTVGVILIC